MNAIGVDVGGTKIAAPVVSPEGKNLNEVRYPTQAVPPNRLIDTISRAITEVKDGFEVGGVCVPVPGLILAAENKVVFAPNLHEIENIRLDEEIGGRTGLGVTVENDANAAAWGEFRFGAGKDVDHQVFITLGTGVGGGVITHGMLLRGAQGAGGELGHVTLDPTGPRGGDLEALASGTAIRRRAREVANDQPRSALGRLAVEREVLGEDVTRLAQEGDEASISVLEEIGRWLGIGLAGFVNIFNPEVIAVGGGATRVGEFILGPARKEVQLGAYSPSRDLGEIKEASLGLASGVLGAADARRLRLLEVREGIPDLLWVVLVVGGVITVSFTYLFGLKSNVAHALMVAALTLLICGILFTIAEFNYAFSGAVEIRPDAFREVLGSFGGS